MNVSMTARKIELKQDQPITVLINARMRTGSSLIGRYLSNNPDSMYLYEPELALRYNTSLHYNVFNDSAAHLEKLQNPFYEIIEGFFDCDYTRRSELLPFMNERDWLKSYNGFALLKGSQFNAKRLNEICKTKRHRVVKTVRINDISKGLSTLKKYDVKVIQVVRDPRGMINSRINFEKQHLQPRDKRDLIVRKASDACRDYCIWLKTNIDSVLNGPKWLKEHYLIVRYEDLIERPRKLVPNMHHFISIPTNMTDAILSNQTLRPDSAFAWRHSLPYYQTRTAQNNCPDEIFETLGYVKVQNENQQRNVSFSLSTSPNISKLTSLA
ncbi:carbohydrate sulfotransferase 1-like [Saccoglossus kowalevskii]|uniref:Carbohydrate sulfotransferase 1-like n=1 Tax=Saccoglossus kowalevskii TaxID=10224 RepID=A0ABM0MNL3_SACKO|nr:PREDICTED: carbohydrate sulfotransferase 1-like [Saccoglossus kowalevskii]